jgi:hypothetical protein
MSAIPVLLPGSAEFMEAYQAALASQLPRPIGASRTRAGSIGALVVSYLCSPSFRALAPGTQRTYRLIIEKFRSEHGDKPVALLTRQHINAMLAQKIVAPGSGESLAAFGQGANGVRRRGRLAQR